jgi:hypothetical protein
MLKIWDELQAKIQKATEEKRNIQPAIIQVLQEYV